MGSFIFALLAGAAITAQAGNNSQLKHSLKNPITGLIVNYMLGTIGVLLVAAFVRVSIPASEEIVAAPWWV